MRKTGKVQIGIAVLLSLALLLSGCSGVPTRTRSTDEDATGTKNETAEVSGEATSIVESTSASSISPASETTVSNATPSPETTKATGTNGVRFPDYPRVKARSSEYYDPFVNLVDDGDFLLEPDKLFDAYIELIYMNPRQLWLARNSLYARHGYTFKNQELQDYFSKMPWYRADPAFSEATFTEEEKQMVTYIQSIEANPPFSLLGGDVLAWDMDFDGQEDLVQIEYKDYDNYTIHINDATFDATGDNVAGVCAVIDLDKTDKQCELLVPSMGPSSDDSFQLFRYKDGKIDMIGEVYGLMLSVNGDGFCKVRIRSAYLQTWFVEAIYKVAKNGYLLKPNQVEYPVTAELSVSGGTATLVENTPNFKGEPPFYSSLKLRMDLPLFTAPGSTTSAGKLKKGTIAVCTASNEAGWVKIQSTTGLVGWFELQDFNDIVIGGKTYGGDQVFEGLFYAD